MTWFLLEFTCSNLTIETVEWDVKVNFKLVIASRLLVFVADTEITLHKKWSFPLRISSVCDQIRSFLRIWSHLLKKSLMEYFIFVQYRAMQSQRSSWTMHSISLNLQTTTSCQIDAFFNFSPKLHIQFYVSCNLVSNDYKKISVTFSGQKLFPKFSKEL